MNNSDKLIIKRFILGEKQLFEKLIKIYSDTKTKDCIYYKYLKEFMKKKPNGMVLSKLKQSILKD